MVDEVELIEANPNYANIRFADGREDTVALKHLAPKNDQEARKDLQAQKTSHLSHQLSRKLLTMSRIENMLHTIRLLLDRPQAVS